MLTVLLIKVFPSSYYINGFYLMYKISCIMLTSYVDQIRVFLYAYSTSFFFARFVSSEKPLMDSAG